MTFDNHNTGIYLLSFTGFIREIKFDITWLFNDFCLTKWGTNSNECQIWQPCKTFPHFQSQWLPAQQRPISFSKVLSTPIWLPHVYSLPIIIADIVWTAFGKSWALLSWMVFWLEEWKQQSWSRLTWVDNIIHKWGKLGTRFHLCRTTVKFQTFQAWNSKIK